MTNQQIVLVFDTTIDPSSVNVTGIRIQENSGFIANSSLYYRLTSSQSILVNNTTITINMSSNDYEAIQVRLGVATSESNTYLTMDNTTVSDNSNARRMAEPIFAPNALQVANFIPDQVQPEIMAFSLNLEATTMTLTFTEPVRTSSLSPQSITLLPNLTATVGNTYNYSLTGGVVHSSITASRVITFNLETADIIRLKASMNLATRRENTYISVSPRLVRDTNENLNRESVLRVSNFTADTTAPRLSAFDIDLTSETLTLYFDDVVNASTSNASGITLLNGQSVEPTQMIILMNTIPVSPTYDYLVIFPLSTHDINRLKQMRSLCTNAENCYMSTAANVVHDPYDRTNIPVSETTAVPVQSFSPDTIPPEMIAWSMDMNEGLLGLSFSETVDITTFQIDQITLQSSASVGAIWWTLTSYTEVIPVDAAAYFEARLATSDLNGIKTTGILSSQLSSFISLTSSAIVDMSDNPVVPIRSSNAFPLNLRYVNDTTSPSLVSFSADLYTGRLTLTFDEVVHPTFDPSALTFVNPTSSSSYSLTMASSSSTVSTILHITLSEHDLQRIRNVSALATSINTTFLSANSGAVTDVYGNNLDPIPTSSPLQVSNFVDSPILISIVNTSYFVREGETLTLQMLLNATTVADITFDAFTEDVVATGRLSIISLVPRLPILKDRGAWGQG